MIMQRLTSDFSALPMLPPLTDSGFECSSGVPGRDDVLFILGVNIFESDNDLEIEGFSREVVDEPPRARLAALSLSEVALRFLKLNFGRRLFLDDLPLVAEAPGDPVTLVSLGLGVRKKFTFFGVGLGVGGIFILTES